MIIAVKKQSNGMLYVVKDFFDRFSHEDLYRYGLTAINIPDDIADFEVSDFNDDLTFSFEKYNTRKNHIELNKELNRLKDWFDEYDNQVKQYQRCVRLGLEFDKDIVELDNQAKTYQEELRKLKTEV